MTNVPSDLKYANSHEWLRVGADGVGVVGITDHAQQELTEVVFVEPPRLGAAVSAGQSCAVVESVKTASEIYSPASGEVIAFNEALESNPGLINTDPYGEGWLFKLRLKNPKEADALLSAADYSKIVNQ